MNIPKICFQILPLTCSLHAKITWPGTGQNPELVNALYWKSANDIILCIRTIKTNICKLINVVGLAPVLFFQDSIMHLIAVNQGPALPNDFLAQKILLFKTIINSSPMYPYDIMFASFPHLFAPFPLFLRSFRIFPHLFDNNSLFADVSI